MRDAAALVRTLDPNLFDATAVGRMFGCPPAMADELVDPSVVIVAMGARIPAWAPEDVD